jgi:hypothetical protein
MPSHRIELWTLALLALHSNQLSYEGHNADWINLKLCTTFPVGFREEAHPGSAIRLYHFHSKSNKRSLNW